MLKEFLSKRKNKQLLLWPPTFVWVGLMIYTMLRIFYHWPMLPFLFPVYYIVAGFIVVVAGLIIYFEAGHEINRIRDEHL
jgi:hypothetical protein